MSRIFALGIAGLLLLGISTGAQAVDKVKLELTYPNGKSPKVFTTGWTFGVKATLNPGTRAAKDISGQVKWSGSGTFSPSNGSVSHPVFRRAGRNTIKLSVVVDRQEYSEEFPIEAVIPHHATIGCRTDCPNDAHGCPACPHHVNGVILTGNSKVLINGRPVACVGDTGTHTVGCCGTNIFTIAAGDTSVLVDGKPVARIGDKTNHCGGAGRIIEASTPNGNTSVP